jgi:flagellar hook-basal body complex protein FliE
VDDPLRITEVTPRSAAPNIDPRTPRMLATPPTEGASFADVLSEAVTEVQKLQGEADTAIRQLVSGEVKDVTEAMVAIEKADVSFQTMMAIRNKIVAAYEEVMRMQV